MILEKETFEKFGYYLGQLSFGSNKKVIVKCDYCNSIIYKDYGAYNKQRDFIKKDACKKCCHIKERESLLKKYNVDSPSKIGYVVEKLRKPIKIGQKFNKLTIIGETYYEYDDNNISKAHVKCRCDCGKEGIFWARSIKRGDRKSCGCYPPRASTHGFSRTKLWGRWRGIKDRCYDKKNGSYNCYGGKGIKVCDKWLDFLKFKEWAENSGYQENLVLDRIDSDKDYCPENCQWITSLENGRRVTSSLRDKINILTEENERLKSILTQNNISYSL